MLLYVLPLALSWMRSPLLNLYQIAERKALDTSVDACVIQQQQFVLSKHSRHKVVADIDTSS